MDHMDHISAVRHKTATPGMVEDLLQGLNEWRNIQDIVRLTFKAFHDVLKAQGDAIKTLERVVDTKANRNEIASALAAKASAAEVNARLHDLETQLFRKSDAEELGRFALKSDVEEALGMRLGEARSLRDPRTALGGLGSPGREGSRQQRSLRADVDQLSAVVQDLQVDVAERATVAEVSEALQTKADLVEVEAALQSKVDCAAFVESQGRKVDTAYIEQMEGDLKEALSEVAARVSAKADRVEAEKMQQEAKSMRTSIQDLKAAVSRVEQRVGEEEAIRSESLSRKVDCSELHRTFATKVEVERLGSLVHEKADARTLHALKERNEMNDDVAGRLAILRDELRTKASTKDVCAMLDTKANVEDVNRVFVDVCNELDKKCPLEELQKSIQDQAVVNSGLCADMSVGRWIWKSGKTKAGNGVPWNVQTMNTDPTNFIWEKDKATIMTIAPGLYQLTFGFYSKKKPGIQVLVNGDPILSAINNNSYVTHHSSGRLTTVSNHPAGNVTGLTCIDFLALPAKARLAITYQGEERGEGFVSLKKL